MEENMRIKNIEKSVPIMFQQTLERRQGNEVLYPTIDKALIQFVAGDYGDLIVGSGLEANKLALNSPNRGRQVLAFYPVEMLIGNSGQTKTKALEITATANEEGVFTIRLKLIPHLDHVVRNDKEEARW